MLINRLLVCAVDQKYKAWNSKNNYLIFNSARNTHFLIIQKSLLKIFTNYLEMLIKLFECNLKIKYLYVMHELCFSELIEESCWFLL